jgi:hypothetical protein
MAKKPTQTKATASERHKRNQARCATTEARSRRVAPANSSPHREAATRRRTCPAKRSREKTLANVAFVEGRSLGVAAAAHAVTWCLNLAQSRAILAMPKAAIAAIAICLTLLSGCGPKAPKTRDLTGQDRSQDTFESDRRKCDKRLPNGDIDFSRKGAVEFTACMHKHGWEWSNPPIPHG